MVSASSCTRCHTLLPPRSTQIANSSSSVTPTSGDLSSAARLRSSSGSSRNRQNAIRSMTAIWSSRVMRSTPTTGIARRFKARTIRSMNLVRLRTRIMMSPGPMRRASPPWRVPAVPSRCAISAAMLSASRASGAAASSRTVGGCHGAGGSVATGRAIGHTTISPYSPMRLTRVRDGLLRRPQRPRAPRRRTRCRRSPAPPGSSGRRC